ncbi:hypothetical protein [Paracidovorax anthurii]|nr:hypothetical protein [Paracidovorax anthurii]
MLKVYLDSQDYSVLSGKALTPELARVKNTLLGFAESGHVRFVFSSIIVCEVAPTGPHAVQYAIERGDLLTQLCRRNALVYPFQLLELEARALASLSLLSAAVVAETQDWFPSFEFDEPTPLSESLRQCFHSDPMFQAMTRPQRREAERKLFKKGGLRPEVRDAIYSAAGQNYVDAILAKWPMDRAHADVFRCYALGEATQDEASEAMKASLRDPFRLMLWFSENPELAVPLVDLVRQPGKKLGAQMRQLVDLTEQLKSSIGDTGPATSRWQELPMSTKRDWERRVSEQVLGVVHGVARQCDVQLNAAVNSKDVAQYCPGIDAALRSMMSSLWDNVGGSRRDLPSDSQFPDARHAMYAPYVDIFRADRFMAPHIRKQVQHHGTSVVAKLTELVPEIERRLEKACANS